MDIELIKKLGSACEEFTVTTQLEEDSRPAVTTNSLGIPELNDEKYIEIRAHVQPLLSQRLKPEQTSKSRDPVVRSMLRALVMRALTDLKVHLSDSAAQLLVEELGNDLLGFGPIEPFFYDPEVTEIKASEKIIRVERQGVESVVEGAAFRSEQHIRDVLERMLAPTGRKIDMANPEVNARLFDGSRMIAQIPPLAVDGTMITIRRFRTDMTIENLINRNVMSPEVVDFLRVAVITRQNIIVSGGTSSGKTTVLNCLASFIPEEDSIITIEEPAELMLQHSNVRRLEANKQTEYTQRKLVASSLRMAPKRIIVGECREGETFDMLQAMNTGHIGSMTTGHANSAWLMRPRLVNMVQMAGMDLPYEAIIELIAGALDIFVHVTKDRSGRRRLDHICEVFGVKRNKEGMLTVDLNPIWQYNPKKNTFDFVAETFKRKEQFIEEGGWQQ
ncbi:MAG: putative conjugal transfer protein [Pelotomaculum sp. PtaB.Bin104]|nr:MAG: putative conjugal transfer protein [Pelotomaculum sp. PtaB.Bin104]